MFVSLTSVNGDWSSGSSGGYFGLGDLFTNASHHFFPVVSGLLALTTGRAP